MASQFVPGKQEEKTKNVARKLSLVSSCKMQRAVQCLQNEGDIVHKIFDSKKDQKAGHLPFLPAVRCNFGNFCFMIQKEILIICKTRRKHLRVHVYKAVFKKLFLLISFHKLMCSQAEDTPGPVSPYRRGRQDWSRSVPPDLRGPPPCQTHLSPWT